MRYLPAILLILWLLTGCHSANVAQMVNLNTSDGVTRTRVLVHANKEIEVQTYKTEDSTPIEEEDSEITIEEAQAALDAAIEADDEEAIEKAAKVLEELLKKEEESTTEPEATAPTRTDVKIEVAADKDVPVKTNVNAGVLSYITKYIPGM